MLRASLKRQPPLQPTRKRTNRSLTVRKLALFVSRPSLMADGQSGLMNGPTTSNQRVMNGSQMFALYGLVQN